MRDIALGVLCVFMVFVGLVICAAALVFALPLQEEEEDE